MSAAVDVAVVRRSYRKAELRPEDQRFLLLLSILALAAWCLVLWGRQFPPARLEPPKEEPVRVAKLLVKPPEPEVVEPEPEPLPPRVETEPPKPQPEPKAAPKPAAKPAPAPKPKKRSVAQMGLLGVISSQKPRNEAESQRIGPSIGRTKLREVDDVSEDLGSMTGTVGARRKATIGEMTAGLPRGSATNVVLEGSVVTAVEGPAGAQVEGAEGGTSGRTFGEIRRVVAAYVPGLKYLYDKELKRNPSLHGKVTVEFVVTESGRVTGVRLVSSGLRHASLESSILSRIKTWKFPSKAGDATRVVFPFDFVPPAG